MIRVRLSLVVAAALVVASSATVGAASAPKLHPSGFGPHSYAAWAGGEGLPDPNGRDQALYFQKNTSTSTFAAGVAVFRGFEGVPVADVWPLGFWYRGDGHCGAGAPRFNLRVQPPTGDAQTLFFGCNSGMLPGGTQSDDDGTWFERTTVGPAPAGTILSLAIVFDEGDDVGFAFPCPNDTLTDPNSCVYLDNIRAGPYVWQSAADNGGGNTSVDAATLELFWGAPLETLFP